jgi:long-chain fatty acid transport protein
MLRTSEGAAVTHRHRIRFPGLGAILALAVFLMAAPAYPSGFQIMTQGAKAMGMGLAFTAVADDPTAVFYNPAGMGWMSHYEGSAGGSILTRTSGDFQGANPYPGSGTTEHLKKQNFLLPTVYGVAPLTKELNFGIGVYAPYGLGLHWENPNTWTGRFISQNAVIQSSDINASFSYRLIPELSIAAGGVFRLSKVQLERDQAAINPFTNSVADVAHIKLNSDLLSNHGWGWNAALMFKPVDMLSLGVSYRSKVTINYDATAKFTQRLTGNPAFDAAVAASLPQGNHAATTTITFPSTVNIGAAVHLLDKALTLSAEADWTEWSRFKTLDVVFPDLPTLGIHRNTNWTNSWAYRGGIQYMVTKEFAVRGGYYYDKTGQPLMDAGPILSDSNRNVYTAGFGYNTERWGVDVGALYIKFKDRDTRSGNADNFFGVYREAAVVGGINLRLAF